MINDYVIRWSTANHDNVATQLTHYKTNSFAIQNQASHFSFNLMLSEQSGGKVAYQPLIVQGTTKKRVGIFMEVRRNLI